MRDLHLWRLLQRRPLDPTAVAPLLRQLADRGLDDRLPFLGLLAPALSHDDAAVREAAVRALGGATGRLALRPIVHALADADAVVRTAAVEALRASVATDDPLCWVHVLFHPNADVRLQALSEDKPFPLSAFYKLYLLPDPACRPVVERQLADFVPDAASLPLLFDFVERGVLTPELARRFGRAVPWNEWLGFLGDLVPRTRDMTDPLANALQPDWPATLTGGYRPDRLDQILHLFWDPDPPGIDPSPHRDFFDLLWRVSLGESRYFQQWVVFTLLGIAAQRGTWPALAAETCAVFHPPFLLCEWVPLAVRRAALAGFYRAGQLAHRVPADVIRPVIESDVCWRTDAGRTPDLWAMGAVLHAIDGHPYHHLLQWVEPAAIGHAFRADPERSIALLGVPDPSAHGRKSLIRALCLFEGPDRHRLLARLVQTVPGDALDFLDGLDGAGSCALFDALERAEPKAFTENKTIRLVNLLCAKVAAGQVARFVRLWLDLPTPETSPLGPGILARLVHDHGSRLVLPALAGLDVDRLRRFLRVLPHCPGFPYDEEEELAHRLARHEDDEVRGWAAARLLTPEDEDHPPTLRQGLCAEIAQRPDPVAADVDVCEALLASHDPPEEVVLQLTRFLRDGLAVEAALDVAMVKHWRGEPRLPVLGHLWLYRWDQHRPHLAAAFDARSETPVPFADRSVAGAVRWALGLSCVPLRRRALQAVEALLEHWRWHDRPRLEAAWDRPLADALLAGATSPAVARIVLHWHAHAPASSVLADLRERLLARLLEASTDIRDLYHPWIDLRGQGTVAATAPATHVLQLDAPPDPAALQADLTGDDAFRAMSAAWRLLALGDNGWSRLVAALDAKPAATWPLECLNELAACPSVEVRAALRRLVGNPAALPEVRFRLGSALWPAEESTVYADCLDAVCAPTPASWLLTDDLAWLAAHNPGPVLDLHLRLLSCEHPLAHRHAIATLRDVTTPDPRVRQAFLDFLDAGTDRLREWRTQAAAWLFDHGERNVVLPLLLRVEAADALSHPSLLAGVDGPLVVAVTQGTLMAGVGETAEQWLLALLNHGLTGGGLWTPRRLAAARDRVDPYARQEAMALLLANATALDVRQRARRAMRSTLGRSDKLRRVAETFAWGVRIGRQLTGRLFTLEMIAGEELGYTRLNEQKLYISPLPLLRGQKNGREVVRGLILHEYGHHLYHKGAEAEAVWQQAEQEKLHRLLNLVSDEHLERNLRVADQSFGDQLKQLGAFAFQHTAREVQVLSLLEGLRGHAFAVLTRTHLGVARKYGCVAVTNGRILHEMERAGMSFARFVRALRMGMGNRHSDEKVERGLALFKGKFRESGMPRLMEITHELRKIFGEETDLLNAFNQDLVLMGDEDDLADVAEGITNEELQAAIRRALEGRVDRPKREGDSSKGRGYNIDPGTDFTPITNVVPKLHDPVKHASYAQRVTRQADKMRRVLLQLGLGLVPQKLRVQGKSFDRGRTRAMVLKRDPRVLIAREVRYTTDLFLGVLLDCSGSMSSNDNIEKAKLFGTLLAEAARGLRGVDLRLWGFTDRNIYECGTAHRPAVHDLEPDDGNNDAAALWHAATVARASRRRAKLLVMISDGSPTGCSVAALKALVQRLTARHKMLCAQVAVRPLEDVCFPHYVLLEDDQVDACVQRFGAVMVKLVRQALRA